MKTKNFLLTSFSLLVVILMCSVLVFNVKSNGYAEKDHSFGFQAVLAQSGSLLSFSWDKPKPEDNVAFYKLHHGIIAGNYGEIIETTKASNSLALDTSNFETDDHYFALSAVDIYGNESGLSGEIYIDINPEHINTCGNGLVEDGLEEDEDGEVCDGGYMACKIADSSYKGEKKCNSDCNGWESNCSPVESCGDGILNGSEVCEIEVFDGEENVVRERDVKGCVNSNKEISTQECNDTCDGWGVCNSL